MNDDELQIKLGPRDKFGRRKIEASDSEGVYTGTFDPHDDGRRERFAQDVEARFDGYEWDEVVDMILAAAQRADHEDDQQKSTRPALEPYRPFPIKLLPGRVARYVAAAATAIGCDSSFIALPLLACLARAIGNTRVIRLKRSWCEPAIIWAAIVGKSGTHKTPAMAAATVFLEKRQEASIQEYDEAVRQHEQDQALYDRAYADWRKSKNTTDPPPWKPTDPKCRRYLTSDATIEAIANLLGTQPDGLLVVRDELAGWLSGMAEYKGGKGSDLGHWLAMWSATSMTVDRKSTKVPFIHISRASVGVVGGVQPAILRQAIGREHRQNGLCQRLLLAMPDTKITGWTDATIDADAQAGMQQVFDKLFELQPAADADGNPEPYPLDLTPEAKSAFVEYFNAHEVEMHAHDDDLAAAWSKLRAYTARLALVFQLCSWADGEASDDVIDQNSMASAIELSRWFGHEAERVYGLFGEDVEDLEVRELAEWVSRNGGRVTPRDVQQRNRKYRQAGEAEPALNKLVDAGYGHWDIINTTGRQRRDFVLATSVNANGSP